MIKTKTKTHSKTSLRRGSASRGKHSGVLKISRSRRRNQSFGSRFRKPIIAGVVIALFAAPGSWLMVRAQADTPVGKLGAAQTAALERAGNDAKRAAAGSTADTSKQQSNASKDTKKDDKAATKDTKATKPATPAPTPPPVAKPTPAPPTVPTPVPVSTASHDNIISTVFWVGEAADASNANITNTVSAWDELWQSHFGGVDDPNSRNGYFPAGFTPGENPFYFALPYNDFDDNGHRKASAGNCPNAAALQHSSTSWCKNSWIKIVHDGKTAYAQWEDVGPMKEDDAAYVFGTARPSNTWGAKAGLDVSPGVKDYLGLGDVDTVSWSFVNAGSVPAGPWKQVVTTSGVTWL